MCVCCPLGINNLLKFFMLLNDKIFLITLLLYLSPDLPVYGLVSVNVFLCFSPLMSQLCLSWVRPVSKPPSFHQRSEPTVQCTNSVFPFILLLSCINSSSKGISQVIPQTLSVVSLERRNGYKISSKVYDEDPFFKREERE